MLILSKEPCDCGDPSYREIAVGPGPVELLYAEAQHLLFCFVLDSLRGGPRHWAIHVGGRHVLGYHGPPFCVVAGGPVQHPCVYYCTKRRGSVG